jgi:hypothetical protein
MEVAAIVRGDQFLAVRIGDGVRGLSLERLLASVDLTPARFTRAGFADKDALAVDDAAHGQ